MKHLILGTAGHVDHGKTSLIRALTGTDTDRLPEEKARGMTIELGFTHLTLPSGLVLGVVDMPGHEKFIKHMAAGAGGVDIALLVIAADEGIMRQTEEHLEILELLGICRGVVAVTKADLVEKDWLEMVEEEIRDRLQSTRLSSAPIVPVSSVTGAGIKELVARLDEVASEALERVKEPASRLYVDRCFSMTGQGTVVTGTLLGGPIAEGDRLELLPPGKTVRVKKVEVHDEQVHKAYRGQRVAMNLAGTDRDDVERGMALASEGWLSPTSLVDAEVTMLSGSPPIEHNERLRLHIGTVEAIARARVPKQPQGGVALIQLEVEERICPARGDRFILRSYSPQTTLAGGRVVMVLPPRRKVSSDEEAGSIARLASADAGIMLAELIRSSARAKGAKALPIEEQALRKQAYMSEEAFSSAFGKAEEEGLLFAIEAEGMRYLMDAGSYDFLAEGLQEALSSYHAEHPLRKGMPKEEARQKAMPWLDRKQAGALLALEAAKGRIAQSGERVRLMTHEVRLSEKQQAAARKLEDSFKQNLLSPPDLDELIRTPGENLSQVADYLVGEGILVRASSEVTFHKDAVDMAIKAASSFEGQFTAAMLRDALGTSRKYAIALLEWMDAEELTQRSGDFRKFREGDNKAR
ncbi:MAG TPA: selenocysteine-specific translation elongation factor [Bacillota bacterium]|nr:selenocysteine-specific translation elongation factor [Bacillota bacterium]HOH09689.1 selenocysteine-specific translation elongation factor [Bacillota bacterium]HOY89276.1 selenocysteine-specific translation elongation factor [Bacillota bacterium]HPI00576.1 selenocysteine-specific translation elongation factor [Bacillota bacterium]HPM62998.1 selenocysteine-specific translation elongation factor [Bacillota bacterium]